MPGVAKRPLSLGRRWRCSIDAPVAAIAPAPDGSLLAVASIEGPITLIDTLRGEPVRTLPGHAGSTVALDWTPDAALLLSIGHDGLARFWDHHAATETIAVQTGAPWGERVVASPDNARIATAAGRHVRLWTRDGSLVHAWPERASTVLDIAWRRSGKRARLAAASYGSIGLYDLAVGTKAARELRRKGSSLVLAWRPDGAFLVTGDQDASVHFWNVANGRDLMMAGYPRKVRELSWDASGRWLATGGGFQIIVWDCKSSPEGTTPIVLEHHTVPLCALGYQRRGPLLAAASMDGALTLWEPHRSAKLLAEMPPDGFEVTTMAWSIDDRSLFVANEDGDVSAWEDQQPVT
jgi:WD40 repeat protein